MIRFKFTFDPDFIREFKRIIPIHCRQWQPEEKAWYVCEEYEKDMEKLLKRYFTKDIELGLDWIMSWRVLWLIEGAPINVIEASANALLAMTDNELATKRIKRAKEMLLTL